MGRRGLGTGPSLVSFVLAAWTPGCAGTAGVRPPPPDPPAAIPPSQPEPPAPSATTEPDAPPATPPPATPPVVEPPAPASCAITPPTGAWPPARGSGHDLWIPGLYSYDPREPKRVALTFDDGPNRHTARVLDVLAQHGAKATFFVVGKSIWAGTMPHIQRAVREGHALGNHTYRHDFSWAFNTHPKYARLFYEAEITLTQIRVDLALLARDAADFSALDDRVFGRWGRFIGPDSQTRALPEIKARHAEVLAERNEGHSPYPMLLVRPPYGRPFYGGPDRDRGLWAETLNRMGLLNVLWHGSNGDSDPALDPATRYSSRFLVGRMSLLGARGGVVLAHDRMPWYALDESLGVLTADGVTIEPLDALLAAKFGCTTPAALWSALRRLVTPRALGAAD